MFKCVCVRVFKGRKREKKMFKRERKIAGIETNCADCLLHLVRKTVGAGIEEQHAVHEVPLLLVNSVKEEISELKFVPQS